MRDIVVAIFILGSLPLCVLYPHIGVYMWYIVGLLNPHRLAFGFAYHMPAAMLVGAATIAGVMIGRKRLRFPPYGEAYLMAALALLFTLNTIVAAMPDLAWEQWEGVAKTLLMTLLTMMVIDQPKRLRILVGIVAFSVGFYGVKAVPWSFATHFRYQLRGPSGSSIESNNDIGLALNMVLPLILLFAQTAERKIIRRVSAFAFISCIFGVALTYSRGAFLGLLTVLVLLGARSRRRLLVIPVAVLLIGGALTLLPSAWYERMDTIKTYQEDRSAMSRIETWQFAWDLGLHRPLTGGGFQAFRLNPSNFDAHSVYFGLLAEQGFVGLGVFLAMVVVAWRSLSGIRRRARRNRALDWYGRCAGMIQASLAGYLVNGLTLGQQYFDLFYLLIALTVILRGVVAREAAATATTLVATPALGPALQQRPAASA